MISGFRRGENNICALLGLCTA